MRAMIVRCARAPTADRPARHDPRAAVPSRGSVPLHRRSIDYRVHEVDDDLVVVGRLTDTRPWAEGGTAVATVHDMELRVRVRRSDLTIIGATAEMHTFPHTECPMIEEAFAGLVGLSVARGYTREVQARFGGPRGCTHLEHLARSLGPVVIQAVTSGRALAVSRGESEDLLSAAGTTGSPWARDSCHIWAEGGIADQKLAAGWRPGVGPYPSPALVTFIRDGRRERRRWAPRRSCGGRRRHCMLVGVADVTACSNGTSVTTPFVTSAPVLPVRSRVRGQHRARGRTRHRPGRRQGHHRLHVRRPTSVASRPAATTSVPSSGHRWSCHPASPVRWPAPASSRHCSARRPGRTGPPRSPTTGGRCTSGRPTGPRHGDRPGPDQCGRPLVRA